MIVKTTLAISAEHPNLPLDTAATFVGSAATFSITGVPTLPAISVAAVAVSVTNASGAVSTVAAVSGEDGWTATFPASHFAAAGTVKGGVVVAVSGTDENGAARTWTAGVGTIVIISSSPVPAPGDVVYNVRLFDAQPDAPTEGDLWQDEEGGYLIYQDGEAHALGGASITVDDELSETSENPVQNKVVTSALNGKATAAQGAKADAALSRAEAEAGFTDWVWGDGVNRGQPEWDADGNKWSLAGGAYVSHSDVSSEDDVVLPTLYTIEEDEPMPWTATRTRLPTMADIPTDNAQLTNGAGYATTAAMTAALALKADASSLPYALVDVDVETVPYVLSDCFPIVYTISGQTTTITDADAGGLSISLGNNAYTLYHNGFSLLIMDDGGVYVEPDNPSIESLTFNGVAPTANVTPVLGFTQTAALTDRTSSAVSLTESATLAFPAQTAGKARDFVVRLTITETNDVVPSVTFPDDVAYETEGGEWPDLTEAGTYIVRLTEVPKASELETARFFLQCSSAVADATPPSAGGAS